MNSTLDIEKCMKSLSEKRPIFHSEADFQFALAWEIQKEYPKANVRLEYPIRLEKPVEKIFNLPFLERKLELDMIV